MRAPTRQKTPAVPPKPIVVLPVAEYKRLLEQWVSTRYPNQDIVLPSMAPFNDEGNYFIYLFVCLFVY